MEGIGLIRRIVPIWLIHDWVGEKRSLTGVRDDKGAEFGMTWERVYRVTWGGSSGRHWGGVQG